MSDLTTVFLPSDVPEGTFGHGGKTLAQHIDDLAQTWGEAYSDRAISWEEAGALIARGAEIVNHVQGVGIDPHVHKAEMIASVGAAYDKYVRNIQISNWAMVSTTAHSFIRASLLGAMEKIL